MSRTFVVTVEGNIGSGKSTFVNWCKDFPLIEAVTEPVHKWTNLNGVNLLEKYYSDPVTWGATFQSYVTLTMLQAQIQDTSFPVRIMERSMASARNCFVESMLTQGTLMPVEYSVLQEWYNFIENHFRVRADAIVYVRTSPEVSFARMQKRARTEESLLSMDYLKQLHKLHEEWLGRVNKRNLLDGDGTAVFVIDADQSVEHLQDQYKECINNIMLASFNQMPGP